MTSKGQKQDKNHVQSCSFEQTLRPCLIKMHFCTKPIVKYKENDFIQLWIDFYKNMPFFKIAFFSYPVYGFYQLSNIVEFCVYEAHGWESCRNENAFSKIAFLDALNDKKSSAGFTILYIFVMYEELQNALGAEFFAACLWWSPVEWPRLALACFLALHHMASLNHTRGVPSGMKRDEFVCL